jgi:hypothetical protein
MGALEREPLPDGHHQPNASCSSQCDWELSGKCPTETGLAIRGCSRLSDSDQERTPQEHGRWEARSPCQRLFAVFPYYFAAIAHSLLDRKPGEQSQMHGQSYSQQASMPPDDLAEYRCSNGNELRD